MNLVLDPAKDLEEDRPPTLVLLTNNQQSTKLLASIRTTCK